MNNKIFRWQGLLLAKKHGIPTTQRYETFLVVNVITFQGPPVPSKCGLLW